MFRNPTLTIRAHIIDRVHYKPYKPCENPVSPYKDPTKKQQKPDALNPIPEPIP